jgi:methyl-accepting chemotaxis protein
VQKKLAASFLLVTFLCTAVAMAVPRLQSDPMWSAVLVVCLDLAIGLGGAWLVSFIVVRRIKQLASAAALISSGDLTQVVNVEGSDETADLARSFSSMLVNLLSVLTEVKTAPSRSTARPSRSPARPKRSTAQPRASPKPRSRSRAGPTPRRTTSRGRPP